MKIYFIRIDGTWQRIDPTDTDGRLFSRADMAFYGFSGNDIHPPSGMYLAFPAPDLEPVFLPY